MWLTPNKFLQNCLWWSILQSYFDLNEIIINMRNLDLILIFNYLMVNTSILKWKTPKIFYRINSIFMGPLTCRQKLRSKVDRYLCFSVLHIICQIDTMICLFRIHKVVKLKTSCSDWTKSVFSKFEPKRVICPTISVAVGS